MHASLAQGVLHGGALGDDGGADAETSPEACCTVIRFPHEDTYTQQVSLRTGLQADSSLFIKWNRTIKVFMLTRVRRESTGWSCCLEEAEEVAGRQAG